MVFSFFNFTNLRNFLFTFFSLFFSLFKTLFSSQKWQFFLAGKTYFTVKYLQCFSKVFLKRKSCRIFCWKGVICSCKNNKYTCVSKFGSKTKSLRKTFFPNCFQTPKPKLKEFWWKEHFNHWKLTTFFLNFFSWNISQNSKTLVMKTIHTNFLHIIQHILDFLLMCFLIDWFWNRNASLYTQIFKIFALTC